MRLHERRPGTCAFAIGGRFDAVSFQDVAIVVSVMW
jgi:hypothetical protein